MCSTVIHHLFHFCQPSAVSRATYSQKWLFLGSNGQLWGHFHTIECLFLASFASRVVPPHMLYCDPPIVPLVPYIWGLLGLLWPKMALLAQNWQFFRPTLYHWLHFSDEICIESSSFTCFTLWCTIWSTFASCLGPWGGWDLLWPKNGVFGPKWTNLGPFPHHWVRFSDKFCT